MWLSLHMGGPVVNSLSVNLVESVFNLLDVFTLMAGSRSPQSGRLEGVLRGHCAFEGGDVIGIPTPPLDLSIP